MFLQVPRGMEIIILAIIVIVIIFGARTIPEIARAFGRAGGEF
jgi:Sec-independent protein translocase protein TatA